MNPKTAAGTAFNMGNAWNVFGWNDDIHRSSF
jgi:hypothetical protein